MLTTSEVSLNRLIIHQVGNKSADEGYKLSDQDISLVGDPALSGVLSKFFLGGFENAPFHHFHHVSSIDLNEVYSIVSGMFATPSTFVEASMELAKVFYQYSDHPKVKYGELYVVYMKGAFYGNEKVDAIGLYRSENKETFLRLLREENSIVVEQEDGVNINKVDKGCLILNTQQKDGFVVCVIDNTSKGLEAKYWKDEFLKLRASNDNYHQTQNFMSACKSFVTDQLEQEFEVTKTDKIDLLNKTVDYFKNNTAFDEEEFIGHVFEDKDVKESFKSFKDLYADENELEIGGNFEISGQAVKKQSRVFKSVLKLDKNFHVYIHGDKSLIEKGYDEETGKNFYKIFFDEES
jgi:hypothetical protein